MLNDPELKSKREARQEKRAKRIAKGGGSSPAEESEE